MPMYRNIATKDHKKRNHRPETATFRYIQGKMTVHVPDAQMDGGLEDWG